MDASAIGTGMHRPGRPPPPRSPGCADGIRLHGDHHEAAPVHALAEHRHQLGMLLLIELRTRDTHARSVAEQVGQVAAAGADLLMLPVPVRQKGDDDGILACRALDAAAGAVPWDPAADRRGV